MRIDPLRYLGGATILFPRVSALFLDAAAERVCGAFAFDPGRAVFFFLPPFLLLFFPVFFVVVFLLFILISFLSVIYLSSGTVRELPFTRTDRSTAHNFLSILLSTQVLRTARVSHIACSKENKGNCSQYP